MMFVLGAKGNAWAWRNDTWKGVQHFRRTQRSWAIAGAIVWLGLIVLIGGGFWGLQSIMKNNGAYELTMAHLRESPRIAETFGDPLRDGFFPMGSVEVSGASGSADLAIGISGPLAAGTAYSKAVRDQGAWRITSLAVSVDGTTETIVLVPRE